METESAVSLSVMQDFLFPEHLCYVGVWQSSLCRHTHTPPVNPMCEASGPIWSRCNNTLFPSKLPRHKKQEFRGIKAMKTLHRERWLLLLSATWQFILMDVSLNALQVSTTKPVPWRWNAWFVPLSSTLSYGTALKHRLISPVPFDKRNIG